LSDEIDRPDLNRMWETFIRIPDAVPFHAFYDIIRFEIVPLIFQLKSKGAINWHCFLIHDRSSGVPTSVDDPSAYFHIRVALEKDADSKEFLNSLPSYCIMTRKIERNSVENIAGVDKSRLKNDDIEEAWRIIGEQSQWFMDMLNIHKEDVKISAEQVFQFLHYFSNMAQLQI